MNDEELDEQIEWLEAQQELMREAAEGARRTSVILMRVMKLHQKGPIEGRCQECRKPWPCPTFDALETDPNVELWMVEGALDAVLEELERAFK